MTGGELQLKAYGSENIYLNANPQISFFRSVFKRHTNFAMENYTLVYNGTSSMNEQTNTTFTFNIKRYGDLLGPLFFVVHLPNIYSNNAQQFRYIKNLGSTLIERATLYISGQKICEIQGDTINNYHRLSCNYPTNLNYNEMIGHTPAYYDPQMLDPNTGKLVYRYSVDGTNPSILSADLYIPIPFFFTNNSGLYLPLIGLQRSEVTITVETKRLIDLYTIREDRKNQFLYNKRIRPSFTESTQSIYNFIKGNETSTAFAVHLEAQYVFLDNDERQQFSSLPNEYLIQQVQYKPYLGVVDHRIIDMYFFHPTKEMRFMLRKTDGAVNFNEWTNYGNNDTWGENFLEGPLTNSIYRSELNLNGIRLQLNLRAEDTNNKILKSAKFLMNGQDRTREFVESYWRSVQVFQYHLGSTNYPFRENDFFNVFSYGLEPDTFQPSGSCNLTNLKSYQLDISTRLPPVNNQWYISYYELTLMNNLMSSFWRNPQYSTGTPGIFNVFNQYLNIFSLQSNSEIKEIYGSYQLPNTNNLYNILISPVEYNITEFGTIENNEIILNGALMKFYDISDIYYETNLFTNIVMEGKIGLIYLESQITRSFKLNFINLQPQLSTYDIYYSGLSQEQFLSLVNPLNTTTGFLYTDTYKSLNKLIDEEIFRQINIKADVNTNKNQTANSFELINVDFINKFIFGKYYLVQTDSDFNGNIVTNTIIYYSVINYAVDPIISGNYYTIPLTNQLFTLYEQNNFATPAVVFDLLLPLSLIIFQVNETSNANPDALKNYLWRYDLFIEAHNYNLLRVVNGEGSVAYST